MRDIGRLFRLSLQFIPRYFGIRTTAGTAIPRADVWRDNVAAYACDRAMNESVAPVAARSRLRVAAHKSLR
jgi:hypothetical protein